MAEDYRAGATIGVEHDRRDRHAGARLRCPVFAPRERLHTAAALRPIREKWADDVSKETFACGHFVAEEAPEDCVGCVRRFLTAD